METSMLKITVTDNSGIFYAENLLVCGPIIVDTKKVIRDFLNTFENKIVAWQVLDKRTLIVISPIYLYNRKNIETCAVFNELNQIQYMGSMDTCLKFLETGFKTGKIIFKHEFTIKEL